MVVAVDEGPIALAVQRNDVGVVRHVQLAELAELGRHRVGELVERGLHDRSAPRSRLRTLSGPSVAGRDLEPGEVVVPVRGVEEGELVDQRDRDVEDVFVVHTGEAAPGCLEVLEHHDERVVALVELTRATPGHAHRKRVPDRGVEAGFGDAEADHAQELLLFGEERLELHEERVGNRLGAETPDRAASGGAGVRVEHFDVGDRCVEDFAEPGRCQLLDGRRDHAVQLALARSSRAERRNASFGFSGRSTRGSAISATVGPNWSAAGRSASRSKP